MLWRLRHQWPAVRRRSVSLMKSAVRSRAGQGRVNIRGPLLSNRVRLLRGSLVGRQPGQAGREMSCGRDELSAW